MIFGYRGLKKSSFYTIDHMTTEGGYISFNAAKMRFIETSVLDPTSL